MEFIMATDLYFDGTRENAVVARSFAAYGQSDISQIHLPNRTVRSVPRFFFLEVPHQIADMSSVIYSVVLHIVHAAMSCLVSWKILYKYTHYLFSFYDVCCDLSVSQF